MTVEDIVALMVEKKIEKLPIIERGRLVGIVTLTDLVRSRPYVERLIENLPVMDLPFRKLLRRRGRYYVAPKP